MRFGAALLLFLIVAASIFNAVMLVRARRESERRDLVLRRVDAFLVTWAQTWGQPAEDVRALLMAILKEYPTARRRPTP